MQHPEYEAQAQGHQLGSCIHHGPVDLFALGRTREVLPSCARTCPGSPHRNRPVPPACARRTCFEHLCTATRRRPTTSTEATIVPRRSNPTVTSTRDDLPARMFTTRPEKETSANMHRPWTLQLLFFLTLSVSIVESGSPCVQFLTQACD